MGQSLKRNYRIYLFIMLAFSIFCIGMVSAEETWNTGQGKPRGMDIYLGDIPYSSSLSGAVNTTEKGVGDFQVIVDDNKPGKEDPEWFEQLGEDATTPTVTPTPTPLPTATTEIEVSGDGPGKQLCVKDSTSEIIVEFAFARCGYTNRFKLSSPSSQPLGWSQGDDLATRKGTDFGTTWNLGTFPTGTELIFAVRPDDTGYTYYTGPASRNPDNLIHGAVSLKNTTGTYHKYMVSFEDYYYGGDKDYNDVEFYVSGNVSTDCSSEEVVVDTGSGALIPVNVKVCKCRSPTYNYKGKVTCVAKFTYNSTVDNLIIPVGESSLPWNEFTGSGMVKQYRCQPYKFYTDSSPLKPLEAPFWTNRFWNNIKWKLGHSMDILVKCESSTPWCDTAAADEGGSNTVCNYCIDGIHY